MYDLNELYYFVQVVEYSGYSAASRALDIPKSKLSRAVSRLEERLQVRLLHRNARQFSVTDVGAEYHQLCKEMLTAADAAEALIERSQAEPGGIVRISCPTALLNFVVAGMLSRFMIRYPRVKVQVESTNREVDVLREGFDIALRVGVPPLQDSNLVMKTLSQSPQELVASPWLIDTEGAPSSPEDLQRFPSLEGGTVRGHYEWTLQGPDGANAKVSHEPRLVTDDLITVRRLTLDGGGIAQLPLLVVFKDLMQGSLVRVLPDWQPQGAVVHAVFASRQGLLPSVRYLLDFLGDSFGEMDFSNLYEGYVLRGDEDACFLTGSSL
ncbi:MAG: LysR family transcriptional regulator [Oceanospirillaceae bacterium]|nr:LysR family transcriptional regulator [Oceanospirillaceae bacterium]